MAVEALSQNLAKPAKSRGHLARALSRLVRKKIAMACIVALVLLYSGGIFAAWVSPYSYRELDYTALQAQPPSLRHIAGTDFAGRDVFTRVLWGIQNTVILTVVAMATGSLLIGISLGLVSGYFGGRIDSIIMRIGELFSSFPDILLAIILAATLRPRMRVWVGWIEDHTFLDGLQNAGVADYVVVSLALVSFSWIAMARLVRGQVLVLKETQFIDAARSMGASTPRILFTHLLPNAISPIVITVTLGMGTVVGTEIILSWLGLGIQPPRPSLGTMLLDGGSLSALQNKPWLLLAPGFAATLLVVTWSLLGDALNDVLNPRTR